MWYVIISSFLSGSGTDEVITGSAGGSSYAFTFDPHPDISEIDIKIINNLSRFIYKMISHIDLLRQCVII